MFEWIVAKKLKQIAKHAAPDRAFVRALEHRLTGRSVGLSHRMKLAAGSLSGLLIVFGGTGAYAYASDNVLPGTALYPVRTTIEQAEESVAVTPASRATVLLRHVQRREHEREIMEKRHLPVNTAHEQAFVVQVESALAESDHLSPQERAHFDAAISLAEKEYAASLDRVKRVSEHADEKERATTLLSEQTKKLQTRVLALDPSRREQYTSLLERRVTAIDQMKKNRALTNDEIAALDALEKEYTDAAAVLDQQDDAESAVDAVTDEAPDVDVEPSLRTGRK